MVRNEELIKAIELYRSNFNSLPFETRKSIASPVDRISENDIAIKMAEAHLNNLKKRRKELEDWLLEWYKSNHLEG